MKKKRLLIVLSCSTLLIAWLGTGRNSLSSHSMNASGVLPSAPPPPAEAPDHVVYGTLFSRVNRLNKKTRELRDQGKIGQKPYFHLQKEANLNQGRATALDAIASACQEKVERLDERARVTIAEYQSQFPGGRVPKSGQPPLPPELKTMWEERNQVILRARDQLRTAFGKETFDRFNEFARFHYGGNKGLGQAQ